MQAAEALVPITMFAGGFAMVFGIVYLKTRENMAMIEKGMNPKEKTNRPAPFKSLKAGLLFLGAGLGLLTAFFLDMSVIPYNFEPVGLYFALIAIGGGLGLIGSYWVEKKHWYDKGDQ
ncbi:MAG TPA: DUF6249 domain-containing protein [Chitinophagaceae bacterium]|nr:DUF6249 domain-containing protein [Chitinophagaceae bacterium]